MYIYKWPDYGDSHQRHQKWYVKILSKLECELYLIWKYEGKDEYLSVYILMFIYQLNRIEYSQQYRMPYVGLVYTKLSAWTVSMLGQYRQR